MNLRRIDQALVLFLLLSPMTAKSQTGKTSELPKPFATKSVRNYSHIIGWPVGKTPFAPKGFQVKAFADGLINPRNIYVAPSGDVFVAEANTEMKGIKKLGAKLVGYAGSERVEESANRITLLRPGKTGGTMERTVFLSGLNRPFGMLIVNSFFYVANTDGVFRYPYREGQIIMTEKSEKILDLPAVGYNNHWTRNLILSPDKTKIYVTVGSGSNVGENGMQDEVRRASILEIDLEGKNERIFASGLRNPVGMAFEPIHQILWTAVNERDELGDELVPDYFTHVEKGGFYGWPYSYLGKNLDPRVKEQKPKLVAQALTPDFPLGSHTATLGLAFNTTDAFPKKYKNGAFLGQHGSWNRSELSGYKVIFVPFADGKPSGPAEDFLTGFIAEEKKNDVYGRPAMVAFLKDGSLLVADDSGNTVWRVSAL